MMMRACKNPELNVILSNTINKIFYLGQTSAVKLHNQFVIRM